MADPTVEAAPFGDSRAWRIVRMVCAVLGILCMTAFLAGSLALVIAGARLVATLGDTVSQLQDPVPAATGCPFGEDECGG